MTHRYMAAIVVAALLGGAAIVRFTGGTPDDAGARAGRGPSAGMRVQLDGDGRPVVPTPGPAVPSTDADVASGALQRPVPRRVEAAPGGGEMVVLDGLVKHQVRATRQGGGSVGVDCADETP